MLQVGKRIGYPCRDNFITWDENMILVGPQFFRAAQKQNLTPFNINGMLPLSFILTAGPLR